MYVNSEKIYRVSENRSLSPGNLQKVRSDFVNQLCKNRSVLKARGVVNRCFQLREIPGVKADVDTFCAKTYTTEYFGGINGHFNATYKPSDHKLDILLPVFFDASFDKTPGKEKEVYFIKHVGTTWSKNNMMQPTFGPSLWSIGVGNVDGVVKVEKKSKEDDAFFKIKGGAPSASVSSGEVDMSDIAYDDTKKAANEEVGSMGYKNNVYGHEAGHMFGLGDEYGPVGGTEKATHYDLTKEAFDEAYADNNAVRDDGKTQDSIMNETGTVHRHHYVTFWDAMVQAIKAGAPDKNKAPNMREDWKII